MKPGTLIKTIGVLGVIGTTVAMFEFGPTVTKISLCVAMASNSIGVYLARQNNVTSEQAGAENHTSKTTETKTT